MGCKHLGGFGTFQVIDDICLLLKYLLIRVTYLLKGTLYIHSDKHVRYAEVKMAVETGKLTW